MKNIRLSIQHFTGTTLLIAALAFVQACSSDGKKESRTEDAAERTGDAISADTKEATADAREDAHEAGDKIDAKTDEIGADFKHDRDVVVTNIKTRMSQLDTKIDELQAKAKRKGDKVDADTDRKVADLKSERDDLGNDLDKAKNSTADAWKDVKKGFKRAGHELGDAFDDAGDKLKRD